MRAISLLQKCSLFSSAAPESLKALVPHCDVRMLCAGEHLFHADSPQNAVVFLAVGRLALYRRNKQRDVSALVGILSAPSLFGDAEWGAKVAWMESVRAEEDTQVVLIANEAYERFLRKEPEVLFQVYRDACVRHMLANQSVQCLALYDVRTRLLRVLLDFINQTGSVDQDQGLTGRSLRVSDFSAALGVTERTVARTLAELKSEGLLDKREETGEYFIVSLSRIRELVPAHLLGLSSVLSGKALPVIMAATNSSSKDPGQPKDS